MNSWTWTGVLRKGALLTKLRTETVKCMWSGREQNRATTSPIAAEAENSLEGLPILIGGLHSMLPITLNWIAFQCAEKGMDPPRVAYVMTDEGVLPPACSRHVSALRRLGLLCGTITYGSAGGGDIETEDKETALLAARCLLHADLIIVCMGPGVTGAGSRTHDSGVAAAGLIHAAARFGAVPIWIPRVSFADEQQDGLDRHMLETVSELTGEHCLLPIAACGCDEQTEQLQRQIQLTGMEKQLDVRWIETIRDEAVAAALSHYPYSISSMGRTFTQDPAYYRSVCAAAQLALEEWLCNGAN